MNADKLLAAQRDYEKSATFRALFDALFPALGVLSAEEAAAIDAIRFTEIDPSSQPPERPS